MRAEVIVTRAGAAGGGSALGLGTLLNFAGDRDVGAAGQWVVLAAHVARGREVLA